MPNYLMIFSVINSVFLPPTVGSLASTHQQPPASSFLCNYQPAILKNNQL